MRGQRAISTRMAQGCRRLRVILDICDDGGLLGEGNRWLTAGAGMGYSGVEAKMAEVASLERV